MKKQEYLSPETMLIYMQMEAPLCVSGDFEDFTDGNDFPMFGAPAFDSSMFDIF